MKIDEAKQAAIDALVQIAQNLNEPAKDRTVACSVLLSLPATVLAECANTTTP